MIGGFVLHLVFLSRKTLHSLTFEWSFCKQDNYNLYKRPNEKAPYKTKFVDIIYIDIDIAMESTDSFATAL